jgi:hypothetical protein
MCLEWAEHLPSQLATLVYTMPSCPLFSSSSRRQTPCIQRLHGSIEYKIIEPPDNRAGAQTPWKNLQLWTLPTDSDKISIFYTLGLYVPTGFGDLGSTFSTSYLYESHYCIFIYIILRCVIFGISVCPMNEGALKTPIPKCRLYWSFSFGVV